MNKDRYFLHFKGGLYEMLAIAKDSETLENMVVYQALYGDNAIWVRPEKAFFEVIIVGGVQRQRFEEITKEKMLCLYRNMKKSI